MKSNTKARSNKWHKLCTIHLCKCIMSTRVFLGTLTTATESRGKLTSVLGNVIFVKLTDQSHDIFCVTFSGIKNCLHKNFQRKNNESICFCLSITQSRQLFYKFCSGAINGSCMDLKSNKGSISSIVTITNKWKQFEAMKLSKPDIMTLVIKNQLISTKEFNSTTQFLKHRRYY